MELCPAGPRRSPRGGRRCWKSSRTELGSQPGVWLLGCLNQLLQNTRAYPHLLAMGRREQNNVAKRLITLMEIIESLICWRENTIICMPQN